MDCVTLSKDALITTSDLPSGLCTVCHTINFESTTRKVCSTCSPTSHFHIGSLEQVEKKKFCPGCRLILSACKSTALYLKKFHEPITILSRTLLATPRENSLLQIEGETEEVAAEGVGNVLEILFEDSNDSSQWTTAGNIIRVEETAPICSVGPQPSIFRSDIPFCVQGRNVPLEVNINLIRHWVRSCDTLHGRCHLPALKISRKCNVRLIDVEDRRIISTRSAEKYVTLSYAWGPTIKPLLVKETKEQCFLRNGLDNLVMPRTISDAIQLVRDIGFRYLWVDSLCIVQDDDNDKQQQLLNIGNIYNHATLVIVAAAGNSASAGLPGIGCTQRRLSQQTEKIDEIEFKTIRPALQHELERSIWRRRGWTFQEAMLSRRALVFTESLVYWSCLEDTYREDIQSESPIYRFLTFDSDSLWDFSPRKTAIGTLGRSVNLCRTRIYCDLVENLSERIFKHETDIIWAFIGILRLHISRFPKGFIWCHPYENLDATLLWVGRACNRVHERQECHNVVTTDGLYKLAYPSWSWLSIKASVSFLDVCGASIISEVNWHRTSKGKYRTPAIRPKPAHSKYLPHEYINEPDVGLLADSTSESDIMDYEFLYLTAETTVLTIRQVADEDGVDEGEADEAKRSVHCWVLAAFYSLTGEEIGMLNVHSQFFNGKRERSGELLLLSSNAQTEGDEFCKKNSSGFDNGHFKHVDGCRHILSRNVMLIEWVGDVAYRRGLGQVKKEGWEKVKTQTKEITLG